MQLDGVMVRTTEALAPGKALLMGKPGGGKRLVRVPVRSGCRGRAEPTGGRRAWRRDPSVIAEGQFRLLVAGT